MDIKIFEKYGFQFAQSKAYFKLYNNLGFAICIDPDLKENNIYVLYDSFRLIFNELTIVDEIGLSKFDTDIITFKTKFENSFDSINDYINYLIDYFNIHGYNVTLYKKQGI